MAFFDIDYNARVNELNVPKYRLNKFTSWLYCLVFPIQYLRDLFLGDYKTGATYPVYNAFTTYNAPQRVLYYDRAVYECQVNGTITGIAGPASDPVAWVRVQDLFIGTDERVRYTSQIMTLEYALNHYYFVAPAAPDQIYIGNNTLSSRYFIMGDTGPYSSDLVNYSSFARTFMGDSPSFVAASNNFTIYVPTSLLSTLGLTLQDQINNVRQFVNKYKLAGISYNVVGY